LERKSPKIPFVNLHSHTNSSIFDGLCPAPIHMDAVYAAGMDAMAISDHGVCNAYPMQLAHQQIMAKRGEKFKNIYGCEAYLIDDIEAWHAEYNRRSAAGDNLKEFEKDLLYKRNHFLLLVQNQKGLNNLFSLISTSHTDKYYYKHPRIDLNLLRKYNEGLIVGSACIGGYLATSYHLYSHLSETDVINDMRRRIQILMDIFGERFYGEIQWNAIFAQHEINHIIFGLSREMGFKIISTNDSHYPTKELWRERELYKRLGWASSDKKAHREDRPAEWMTEGLPGNTDEIGYELYPRSGDETFSAYKKYVKAMGSEKYFDDQGVLETLANTVDIAFNQIEDFSPDKKVRLPKFVAPEGDEDVVLAKECISGLKKMGLSKKKNYVSRLKDEIHVIQDRKFSRYFLTMKAVIDKAKETQLVGLARGSSAGSLAAYCLGITLVDPIKYGLQFERFLRRDATDYPDIDTDVEAPMELKEQLIREWGQDVVCPISNWNTMQLKSLIKDVAKFYEVPFQEVNEVTSKMLFEATPQAKKDHDITTGVYTPTYDEAKKYSKSLAAFLDKYAQIDQHVKILFGQIRSCSRHAGGIIVSDELSRHMPLIRSGGVIQSPWSEGVGARHLEPNGFIKYDLLGLATLRMIRLAIENILRNKNKIEPTFQEVQNWYNEVLHPDHMNLDDQSVYEGVFQTGKFLGTFQFGEHGIQDFAMRSKPKSIEELSAINAIYRPGPLGVEADDKYIEAKSDSSVVKYKHKLIKKVLGETFGLCIYQEQISSLAHELGKEISLNEGNVLRKLLVKTGIGKQTKEIKKIKDKFTIGCLEKGLTSDDAEEFFTSMQLFSQYGFNKSHSVSYSLTSYQCAYLWTHYPTEWALAFLEKEDDKGKEKAISLVKGNGFTILPFDINCSGLHWTVSPDDPKSLLPPITGLLGLGEKAAEQIIANRPYSTIEEFIFNENIDYGKMNRKALDVLIRSEALDPFMDSRFANLRHFHLSILGESTKERPKTAKRFAETIEKWKGISDYTDEEKIEAITDITGIFPLDTILTPRTLEAIEDECVPPISEYDAAIGHAWFIPRKITPKKTGKGRNYVILDVIDSNFAVIQLKVWGIEPSDRIFTNIVYSAPINFQEQWGYSIRTPKFMKQLSCSISS
jgi:DNA polymerase III subunit alpha